MYVPSMLYAFFVIYMLFRIRELWARLTNHLIIGIFLVNFIQVSTLTLNNKSRFLMIVSLKLGLIYLHLLTRWIGKHLSIHVSI